MDKPIIFSAPMVRALLDGRKTQTRRILKPQPELFETAPGKLCDVSVYHEADGKRARVTLGRCITLQKIPHAKGDRLWVREAWRCNGWATDVATIFYRASEGYGYTAMCEQYPVAGLVPMRVTGGWRPSIHMPRWAPRLTLEVTGVKVERLQDISDEDAEAEGCPPCENCGDVGWINEGPDGGRQCTARGCGDGYVDQYARLWDATNGPGSWDANPWIAAYTFTVHHCNIDAKDPDHV